MENFPIRRDCLFITYNLEKIIFKYENLKNCSALRRLATTSTLGSLTGGGGLRRLCLTPGEPCVGEEIFEIFGEKCGYITGRYCC